MKNFNSGKIIYTLLVVLVTAWSVFFIANYYHDKKDNNIISGIVETTDEDGNTQIVQEVVEREVVTQEEARIDAINTVSLLLLLGLSTSQEIQRKVKDLELFIKQTEKMLTS